MILSTLITGLLAASAYAKESPLSHRDHDHAKLHSKNAEFRSLQEADSYSAEVTGISLTDVEMKIPDVSSLAMMSGLSRRFHLS